MPNTRSAVPELDRVPVVLVLVMVLPVISPDSPVEARSRLVVAVDEVVGPLVAKPEHRDEHQVGQSVQARAAGMPGAQWQRPAAAPTAGPSTG